VISWPIEYLYKNIWTIDSEIKVRSVYLAVNLIWNESELDQAAVSTKQSNKSYDKYMHLVDKKKY